MSTELETAGEQDSGPVIITTDAEFTMDDATELSGHEEIIKKHKAGFIKVGLALLAIRDKRLYRRHYNSFQEYCSQRWGFGRAHAHRFIEAAAIAIELSPMGDTPACERQVRPLVKLKPEQRVEAWTAANGTAASEGRTVTTHDVEAAVTEIEERPRVRTADEEIAEDQETVNLPDAFCFGRYAAEQLRRIDPSHPDKVKVLESVIAWCEANKNRKKGWSVFNDEGFAKAA